MANLFARLGFNYTDTNSDITPLTNDVKKTLDVMPKMLQDWQVADLSANTANGYFLNPCANVTSNIWNVSNTLVSVTDGLIGTGNLTNLWAQINSTLADISNNATSNTQAGDFLSHTDRISGVTSFQTSVNENTENLPFLDTAMQTGKALVTLIYQTDGIQNNAPIMGNFTSLFVANTLSGLYNTINSYVTTVNNSITISGGPPPTPFIYTSNLTYNTVNVIATAANSINSTFYTRRSHDEQFFKNSGDLLTDFNKINDVGSGSSEQYLIQNYIGTDKLKSRLA